jgi:hypothetical protein
MDALKTFTASDLSNFWGSENWYYNPLFGKGTTYTDGVKFISDRGCGWMVTDILAVVKLEPKVKREEFVSIKFRKNADGSAVITYDDGNGNIKYRQEYEATDCPVDEINFYFENSVLMLVGER